MDNEKFNGRFAQFGCEISQFKLINYETSQINQREFSNFETRGCRETERNLPFRGISSLQVRIAMIHSGDMDENG